MKENSQKKYNIGLDIGTSSVGWAVTDERYKLLKIHSKNMWGVRLFESAQTAQDRRVSRSARRRYNKRRERIRLLRMLMQDMIDEVDESFFVRMANLSFLNQEDKILESQNRGILYKDGYNLFIDKDYNDVTYYEQFKTIYHLRDYLCETKEKVDPRLIYLALHHIVKYRGNFLCEGQTYSFDNSNICNKISNCIEECLSMNNISILIDDDVVDKVIEILKTVKTKSSKVDELLPLFTFNKEDKQIFVQLMNSLVGKTFSVTKMFPNDEIKNDEKEIKLQFSDSKYDENIEKYSNDIGEKVEIIDRLKEIYSWVELNLILGDSEEGDRISISKAMIKRYENHKSDLKLLKKVIKEEFPDQYYNVFRNEDKKIHNYYNYINRSKDTSTEEFYNYIKKIINSKMSNDIQLIIDKMELETFLLKQNDRANSSIPYQLNKNEMELIIDNQAPYYPILLDNKEKLLSILEFRIPYYYGPLNPNGKFGWIIKNNNERILPWNHEEVVDVQATAEEFIKRLTNFCTYFPDEPVLPKYSLITSKYEVLAELNKITVNGHFLAIDTKRRILNDLFMTKKTVTDTHLRKWLKENQEELNAQDAEIKGYQKENTFSTSLTPWIDFVKIFGEINENNFEIIEKIIYDLTIFEDKKIIEKRLKNLNINLSQKQIKKILSLNYKGWSRLSKKLLFDIRSNYNGNVGLNIIEVMEMSNMALMEIINDKRLNFKKQIENVNNQEIQGKFKHEEVNKLAGSPALKKGIWQSLLIVEEIKKIMKCDPQNIFIEMAREEGKKERTTTAINKLQRLYQTIELETQENEVYKQLKKENGLSKIDSEKLKLYYMQLGKCMYTGKPLKIDELYLYQVDHIVPQSIIKDDSIDNKVLVYTLENQRKLDDLVVPFEIRKKW